MIKILPMMPKALSFRLNLTQKQYFVLKQIFHTFLWQHTKYVNHKNDGRDK
jgi:hypothetical protein